MKRGRRKRKEEEQKNKNTEGKENEKKILRNPTLQDEETDRQRRYETEEKLCSTAGYLYYVGERSERKKRENNCAMVIVPKCE